MPIIFSCSLFGTPHGWVMRSGTFLTYINAQPFHCKDDSIFINADFILSIARHNGHFHMHWIILLVVTVLLFLTFWYLCDRYEWMNLKQGNYAKWFQCCNQYGVNQCIKCFRQVYHDSNQDLSIFPYILNQRNKSSKCIISGVTQPEAILIIDDASVQV